MGDDVNHRGSSRRWLTAALDNSLRRLCVDHLVLFQTHRWYSATSHEETLSTLTDLRRAGKSATGDPGVRSRRSGVQPLAPGWLSGAVAEGREITTSRSAFMPQRVDTTVPANRLELDAVEQLPKLADEAGA